MTSFLRGLRLFAVVLWVGGIAFFAFVVAPVAFRNLPSAHEAGMVVRGCILVLHWIGMLCGAALLLATLLLRRNAQAAVVAAMVLVTAFSQFRVLPAMERDREQAGGAIESLIPDDPLRTDFDRRHILSERLEGAVLLGGFALIVLISRERRLLPPLR